MLCLSLTFRFSSPRLSPPIVAPQPHNKPPQAAAPAIRLRRIRARMLERFLRPLSRLQQQPHGRGLKPAALPTSCYAHRIGVEI
jgi:hypothetical protein